MADFSFSFDSDNPFAEPEQTPKKAPVSTDESPPFVELPNEEAPATPAVDAEPFATATDDVSSDDFSLDSFDFAFDEGASVNDSLPTQINPPKEETRQLTPGEAAFAEFDFGAFKNEQNINDSEVIEPRVEERAEPQVPEPLAEAEAFEPFAEIETTQPIADPEISTMFVATETAAEPESLERDEVAAFEDEDAFAEIENQEVPRADKVSTLDKIKSIGTSRKNSDKSAPSDLEEFNSLTFDLATPADESFEGQTDVETKGNIESAFLSDESIFDEPATVEEPAIDNQIVSIEEPVTIAEPVVEAEVAIEPVTDVETVTELDMPAAVAAAGMLDAQPRQESQAEVEFRRLRTQKTFSVAILGASGIGKNHARWFHRHGCHIAGFLGTSDDSTTQTEANLNAEFDFQGNAYTDLEALLKNEKPDIVCVATPPPLHFAHALQSLEAGAHVLCEKPLVYAPTRKFRENRDGAKELVKVAAKKNLNLGTQLQYGAATPILCKLAGLSARDVGDFAMELETLNPNAPRDPRELWIDLGPHPVSVAQMLAGPGAQIAEETIRFEPYDDDEKTEVLARFGINCADGRLLMVRAVVRALRGEDQRAPRRRFSFNGQSVSYAPMRSAKNGFQSQFIAPDGYASIYPDPVDYLVGNFVNACRHAEAPLITGDFGRENLEWMLKISTPGETR